MRLLAVRCNPVGIVHNNVVIIKDGARKSLLAAVAEAQSPDMGFFRSDPGKIYDRGAVQLYHHAPIRPRGGLEVNLHPISRIDGKNRGGRVHIVRA